MIRVAGLSWRELDRGLAWVDRESERERCLLLYASIGLRKVNLTQLNLLKCDESTSIGGFTNCMLHDTPNLFTSNFERGEVEGSYVNGRLFLS